MQNPNSFCYMLKKASGIMLNGAMGRRDGRICVSWLALEVETGDELLECFFGEARVKIEDCDTCVKVKDMSRFIERTTRPCAVRLSTNMSERRTAALIRAVSVGSTAVVSSGDVATRYSRR
jgi:hypothetical protein